MRLLLIEDDALLGDGICVGLKREGYTVDWLKDGKQGLQALSTEEFDLVVLDLGLPGMDGDQVLKTMRKQKINTPTLILTARDAIADRVGSLDSGADDYMTKPFDLDELAARVRALIRRSHGRVSPLIEAGAISLDPAAHTVQFHNQLLNLSQREFAVLQSLLENVGRVVPRATLEDKLYGWDKAIESNAIEVHIHNLRKKLGAETIKTVRGVGYIIENQA